MAPTAATLTGIRSHWQVCRCQRQHAPWLSNYMKPHDTVADALKIGEVFFTSIFHLSKNVCLCRLGPDNGMIVQRQHLAFFEGLGCRLEDDKNIRPGCTANNEPISESVSLHWSVWGFYKWTTCQLECKAICHKIPLWDVAVKHDGLQSSWLDKPRKPTMSSGSVVMAFARDEYIALMKCPGCRFLRHNERLLGLGIMLQEKRPQRDGKCFLKVWLCQIYSDFTLRGPYSQPWGHRCRRDAFNLWPSPKKWLS